MHVYLRAWGSRWTSLGLREQRELVKSLAKRWLSPELHLSQTSELRSKKEMEKEGWGRRSKRFGG